jgi:hypothetical protein
LETLHHTRLERCIEGSFQTIGFVKAFARLHQYSPG